ncbi:hypothetical protein ACP70R_018575 [Stipagrostis hirtigluma subsp. patula]
METSEMSRQFGTMDIMQSVPDYLLGGNRTYTGMLEEIISSQEERRLQQQLQDRELTYTDLLLGNTNIGHIQNFTATCTPGQNREENSSRYEIDSEREDNLFDLQEFNETNAYDNQDSTTMNEVNSFGYMNSDDNLTDEQNNWQVDFFENLQLEEVEKGRQNVQESATTIATETRSGASEINIGAEEITNLGDTNHSGSTNMEELTEEDVEEFLHEEEIAASEGNNASESSKYTPQIGQEFKSREDANHFFCYYAFIAGFQVVVTHAQRTTSRKRNNEIYKIIMKCNKHGKQPQNKQNEEDEIPSASKEKRKTNVIIRTNCPVVMVVKEAAGIWKIERLQLDHNHELSPGSRTQLFSGKKYMTDMQKGLIRTLNANNIKTRQMIAILSYLRGNVTVTPFDKKAISNYRTKINREVTGNDLMQAQEFFRKKKAEDPTFFYKFDLDDDLKVKNMFWCDGSSVEYYMEYGDLVSFDTTFLTNRYNLPFAPLVGVTGHGQTCLFGCAFMSDETTNTFKWVFETFLEAMGGKHPKTIITDQDGAMKSAIEQIFPNTIHRNCLFHIKKKCYDKNGNAFAAKKGLQQEFEDVINNPITTNEFEILWHAMIEEHGQQNNKYFKKMWEMRKRFIPVYFKDSFCPFLHSTARSEGTNSRFKDNVGPTYSIISFLKEYQRIIETINSSEAYLDNFSRQKRPKDLWSEFYIEEQAMELYNFNIFRKFQVQLKATSRLTYNEIEVGKVYEVYQKPNHPMKEYRPRKYIVQIDHEKEDFSCMCCKFQKDGILCSHILKVIVDEDIPKIPEKYIIDRWRKKDKKIVRNIPAQKSETHELLRYNILSRKAALLSSKGSKSMSTFEFLEEEFDRLMTIVDNMSSAEQSALTSVTNNSSEAGPVTGVSDIGEDEEVLDIQDPERIKAKGRPVKPKRFKIIVEGIKDKMAEKEKAEARKAIAQNKKKNAESASPKDKAKKKRKKVSGESK